MRYIKRLHTRKRHAHYEQTQTEFRTIGDTASGIVIKVVVHTQMKTRMTNLFVPERTSNVWFNVLSGDAVRVCVGMR
jgi:hypothetical protein